MYTVISNAKFDVCFIVISINFYEINKLTKTPTPKIKPNQEGKKKGERTAIAMVAF